MDTDPSMQMEMRSSLSSLSPWVYGWFILFSVLWLLSFIWMWQFSLCCVLFLIPFIFFIRFWYKHRMEMSLNQALKPFVHGSVNISFLALFLQIIGLLIITAFFTSTSIIFYGFGRIVWIVVSVSYYVSVEEGLKLFFSLKLRCDVPLNQIGKTHTIISLATGLGYSMCSGLLWTVFAAFELKKDDDKEQDKYSLFGWLFLMTLIIAVIAMPMHLITGYVMGCKITKVDIEATEQTEFEDERVPQLGFRAYIKCVWYSIFIRSVYLYFLVIGFLVMQFSFFGVLLCITGVVADYILVIKHTKLVESTLPFDYLQRAGQLSIFGYDVLPDGSGQNEHLYNDVSMNFNDEPVIVNVNENEQKKENASSLQHGIQITTASFAKFEKNLDEPMVLNQNVESNDEKKGENTEVHVNEDIFSRSETDSADDTSSNISLYNNIKSRRFFFFLLLINWVQSRLNFFHFNIVQIIKWHNLWTHKFRQWMCMIATSSFAS